MTLPTLRIGYVNTKILSSTNRHLKFTFPAIITSQQGIIRFLLLCSIPDGQEAMKNLLGKPKGRQRRSSNLQLDGRVCQATSIEAVSLGVRSAPFGF